MSSFVHLPLGKRIPDRPHAVSVSLPTMRDVIGYEEKDPEVRRHVASGYPRFVQHPAVAQLARHLKETLGLDGHTLWLCASPRSAVALAEHLGATHVTPVESDGVYGVAHPHNDTLHARARLYLQHTGTALGSRAAEHALVLRGLATPPPDNTPRTDTAAATAAVHAILAPLFAGTTSADLFLAASGMSAGWAAFQAVRDVQAARGRNIWVQLGWLYIDTLAILEKFTASPDHLISLTAVHDMETLRKVFTERGDRIAGVITEVPTNPLVQTTDVEALSALCRAHGVHLVLDPSLQSAVNVDVLPYADLVVTSLTKYTAADGDVIAGLVVVNPEAPDANHLRARVAAHVEPLHPLDTARLAEQIGGTQQLIDTINASTPRVATFLADHPGVDRVWWSLEEASCINYLRLARRPDAVGSVITFTVRGELSRFYDRLRLPKGPSFGMRSTLICPFLYLAHYDLLTSNAGRELLRHAGLNPDLLRLSVGTEPVEDIIAALAEALA